ncbi:MAG: efflux RND transporter permease subunit [Deltaproteobacteria bacterium]|nr:efflux RND transporter permease subunit [Deltaproteobacteria bacterium]
MKRAISWFAENHVAANLLMLFLLIAGIVTAVTMKVEVFPDTTLDMISITVKYKGASPSEIEESIIQRIEERIAGLAGIKQIDSTAIEGLATINIEVIKDWDVDKLLDDVKSEVDRITTLPEEAEKPVVQKLIRRRQVISVALYGNVSEWTLKKLAEDIKDDITNLPGITLAELFGVRKGEVHIEISEETLRRYGLTLGKVAEIVKRNSFDLPAGSVKTSGGEILIRTKGRHYYANDYRNIPIITRPDGSKVLLGDIATLKDGFEDLDLFTRFQGKPAAVIQVFRVADQNALTVAKTIKRFIEKVRPTLPKGVNIAFYYDMSQVLKSRLRLLLKNMAMGLVLVIITLGIFLNLRLSFWITLGIPISFASALWLLPKFDVSINMVSLFAFIMVLGIVVDDAIVIGESVFRKREEGLPPLKASVEGAFLVGRAVIFSVLTTMAAFYPLLLGSGIMGKILRNIPIVVILVLAGSLIEALFILPAHLARSKIKVFNNKNKFQKEKLAARALKRFINGPYKRFLSLCLRWRYATVAFGIAALLLSLGLWRGGFLKFTFFPKAEGHTISCTVTMPAGTTIDRTEKVVSYLEKVARETLSEVDKKRPKDAPPLFKYSVSLIGIKLSGHGPRSGEVSVGSHLAQIYVELLEAEKRPGISSVRLAALWRKKAGIIPDAESITFQGELFSVGKAIEVDLSLADHKKLLAVVNELKKKLKGYPGVYDINDSYLPGKKEMRIKLKPSAYTLGLTLNDLAKQVRDAFYGAEALRFQRGEDEVKVIVRYPESERKSLGSVENMRIRTIKGFEVPFDEVAKVKMEQGYVSIQRRDRRRIIKVYADVDEKIANADKIREDLETNVLPNLKSNYPGLRYFFGGAGKEKKESMADVMKGLVIAFFLIYALLAIPFKSFTQPFIVMAAIPFGIIGAFLGHLIMGFNLSILSMFGIVGLTGVVVNDSLVLVDAANRIQKGGKKIEDAILSAGIIRFRAILLTTLTTFAGLTPIILEKSLQAQFLIPMAVSLAFGVLFATVITLILVPCGYLILDDLHRIFSKPKSNHGI